jgi:hypothetical protein
MSQYAVTAFHQLSHMDDAVPHDDPDAFGLGIAGVQAMTPRPYAVEKIVAWRDRLSADHERDLGEAISWDEASDFSIEADVNYFFAAALSYLAAVVEEEGDGGVAARLGLASTDCGDWGRLRTIDRSPGTPSRFQQLLTPCQFWLPFQKDAFIEAEDWRGEEQVFGSLYRLADDVRLLASLIVAADPGAAEPPKRGAVSARSFQRHGRRRKPSVASVG